MISYWGFSKVSNVYRKTVYCRLDWCAWRPRKKKSSALLSLYYMCTIVSRQVIHQQANIAPCHQSTPTAEWEPQASIYLMPTCDGWPHLLEIQTWESPSNRSMWRCQHFPLLKPVTGCSVVYHIGCFIEIILYIKLITSGIIIASVTFQTVWICMGGHLREGQIDFSRCRCHITKWGLCLLLDSKCFLKDCLYPPPSPLI